MTVLFNILPFKQISAINNIFTFYAQNEIMVFFILKYMTTLFLKYLTSIIFLYFIFLIHYVMRAEINFYKVVNIFLNLFNNK